MFLHEKQGVKDGVIARVWTGRTQAPVSGFSEEILKFAKA